MDFETYLKLKMKNITSRISFKNLTGLILVLSCYGCFIYFSIQSFLEFAEGKIGVNQFSTPVTELALPAITVCFKDVFKNVDNDIQPENIFKNLSNHILTWKDLFPPKFKEDFEDWSSQEIFSQILGACFSLKFNKNLNSTTNQKYSDRSIYLLKGKRYQVCFNY